MFSRSRWGLAAIVVLALAVRVGFLAANPYPYTDSGLAADSAEMARQIDHYGRWFEMNLPAAGLLGTIQNDNSQLVDPQSVNYRTVDAHPQLQADVLQPIGEAVVLAGVWKLTGSERWLPYQILMVVLSALMAPIVFYIGLTLFRRRRAAFLAGIFYAAFPPIAWLSTIPHLDTWAVDFTIVITALLLRARENPRHARWLVCAGVAIGVGSFFRPGVLLIAPLLALATVSRSRWRDALKLGAVPLLVAALLLVPWTIRNAVAFHRFIPTRIGIGQNLWEGLGEKHNTFGAVLNDSITGEQVHAVRPDLVYGTPAYDSLLETWAIKAIEHHPGFYLKLVLRRLDFSTVRLRNRDWASGWVPERLERILFLLAMLTILVTVRRFGRAHLILLSVVIATLVPYLILHLEPRYVLPASFAYLIWTALGADLLIARVMRLVPRRHSRRLAATAN